MDVVEVDGSHGEGGGQILRTAAAFSAITQKPVRISRIRAGRSVPGLKRQHASALAVLAKAVGGRLDGVSEGSSEVTFSPGNAGVGSLSLDMGTAASITLVLQAVVPAVALSGRTLRLELTGGTDVPWSPTFDYFAHVVREAYEQMGIEFGVSAKRRGYYPRGGGTVVSSIRPCAAIKPLDFISREKVAGAKLISRCGSLLRHVAERQLSAATSVLEGSGIRVLESGASEEKSDSPGSSILVHFTGPSTFLGSDAIGARGKPSEEVGREAAVGFTDEAASGACLDSNLADMVLPLLSLAPSPSKVRVRKVTPHLVSGMEIAKQFTLCSWDAEAREGTTVIRVTPRPRF